MMTIISITTAVIMNDYGRGRSHAVTYPWQERVVRPGVSVLGDALRVVHDRHLAERPLRADHAQRDAGGPLVHFNTANYYIYMITDA